MSNWDQVVAELDGLRFVEPALTVDRVAEALDEEPPLEVAADLLGVSGSALRTLVRLPEAKDDIGEGITVAEEVGAFPVLARNYQLLAYVVSDEKNYHGALEITSEAGCLYETLGDEVGVGRCLVDRSRLLFVMDRHTLSATTLQRALEVLPASDIRNRATCFQGLALCHVELEELTEALSFSSKARALVPDLPPYLVSAVHWLDGRLFFAAGRCEEAIESYATALNFYISGYPGQAALVGVELVAAQFFSGKVQAAAFTANRLIEVAAGLNSNEIVCRALQDLIMCEELSKAIVETAWETVLRELDPSSRSWRRLTQKIRRR